MKKFAKMHRLMLSASVLVAMCFGLPEMARAQTAEAYNKEAMTQALATKQYYDLYGILFDFEKATIQRDADALLDDIAAALRNFPQWGLRIIGHTDTSGTPAGNEKLSLDRANAIKQALVSRGIAAARLETVGMGQSSAGGQQRHERRPGAQPSGRTRPAWRHRARGSAHA